MDSGGSRSRFLGRQTLFRMDGKPMPGTRHYLWWTIHNLVAHPLLLFPTEAAFRFHDWTSDKLNRRTDSAQEKGE